MPKVPNSKSYKARTFVTKYPTEFSCTPKQELFCNKCETIVKCDKTYHVESHRSSARHASKCHKPSTSSSQQFLKPVESNFASTVTTAFLAADIPLHKLQHPALKELFSAMKHPCPSASACRQLVPQLAADERERVQSLMNDKKVFIIIDESEVQDRKFINILVGDLAQPSKVWLYECKHHAGSINSNIISQLVDDVLHELSVDRHNFVLLLSDAARYMTLAGTVLKALYPKVFHVTCLAHLLHNCAMKVRARYPSVDKLIASVKAAS